MTFENAIPVQHIAKMIDAELIGDNALMAIGINEIHKVRKGDICFVDHEKYYDKCLNSDASIIIINKKVDCPEGKALLIHEKAFEAYNNLVLQYRPRYYLKEGIDPSSSIHPTAILEPGVIVGANCMIGAYSYIQSNVVIQDHTIIGEHVIIQSGTVIGSDAFYFKRYPSNYHKWRSCGRVVIQDHVDIAACCTINKGVSGDTIIGEGSKLDCQVHIGHGVVIGKNCLFAAQVGIGGKTIVGDEVVLYGQVGLAQNLTIGDKAVVLAKSGVSKSLAAGKTYFGTPATEARQKYKELATLRMLSKPKK